MNPTVSIVIPAKNEEAFLPLSLFALLKAIHSYGGQVEILIVDNGSTDRTVEIAKSFGCKVIKDDSTSTIAKLRNIGARAATGEFLGFVDADCVVADSWLTLCLESVQNPDVGMVGTRAVPDLPRATWVEKAWFRLISGAERPDFPNWIGTSNMLLRRELFLRVQCFDETLLTAEDVNLCRKIRRNFLIRLEKRINTIHLRESKTIRELIRREFWRGRFSVRESFACGAPSAAWPFHAMLFANAFLVAGLGAGLIARGVFFATCGLLHIFLPLIMLAKKRPKLAPIQGLPEIYAVAYLYLLARTAALLTEILEMSIAGIGRKSPLH